MDNIYSNLDMMMELFRNLSDQEKSDFMGQCKNYMERGQANLPDAIHEKVFHKVNKCPHCGSEKIKRNGTNIRTGNQRFVCKACGKSFSATTGTVLFSLKKPEKFISSFKCLEDKRTIAETAKELGVNTHTAFDWRHKALSTMTSSAPRKLNGRVQCDETEIPVNEKGSRNLKRKPRKRGNDFRRNEMDEEGGEPSTIQVVTLSSNTGNNLMVPVRTKRLSAKEIDMAIGDKLAWDTMLITDKHHSYVKFAGRHNIHLRQVLSKDHVNPKDKTINVQRVNTLHSHLKNFLMQFHGVSSKYLANYTSWFLYYFKKASNTVSFDKVLLSEMLSDYQSRKIYSRFLRNEVTIQV